MICHDRIPIRITIDLLKMRFQTVHVTRLFTFFRDLDNSFKEVHFFIDKGKCSNVLYCKLSCTCILGIYKMARLQIHVHVASLIFCKQKQCLMILKLNTWTDFHSYFDHIHVHVHSHVHCTPY